jgi:hypothetical protein
LTCKGCGNEISKKDRVCKICEKVKPGLMTGSIFLSAFAFLAATIFITALFIRSVISEGAIQTALRKVNFTDIIIGDRLPEKEPDTSRDTSSDSGTDRIRDTNSDTSQDISRDTSSGNSSDTGRNTGSDMNRDTSPDRSADSIRDANTDTSRDTKSDTSTIERDAALDAIYNALTMQGKTEITRSDLEKLLEKAAFNDYLSEKLTGYARYAVTGEGLEEITADEIANLVADNKDIIEETTGAKITDEDIGKIKKKLEEDDVLDSFTAEKIDRSIAEYNLDKVRTALSDTTLLIILAVSAAFLLADIALIAFLHKRIRAELNFIGFPVFFAGLLFTAAMLVLNSIRSDLPVGQDYIKSILEPVLESFIGRGILIGSVTLIAGIIMVGGYIIVRKVEKNRRLTGTSEA